MLINKMIFRNRMVKNNRLVNGIGVKKITSIFIVFLMVFSNVPQNEMRDVQAKEKSERIIVSMGDSYSSGEGVPPFYGQEDDIYTKVENPDWLAHRSKEAWGGQLILPGVEGQMSEHRDENWFFVAASGAETKHITGKQKKDYRKRIKIGLSDDCFIYGEEELPAQTDVFKKELSGKDIDYITLTLGGNDVGRVTGKEKDYGFASIINCAATGSCSSKYINSSGLAKKLSKARKSVEKGQLVAKDIEKAYRSIDDASNNNSTIIVAGYPKLFAPNPSSVLISDTEAKMINDATVYFNERLEEIVKDCSNDGIDIWFVPVIDAFGDKGAYTKGELIKRIEVFPQNEDLKDFKIDEEVKITKDGKLEPNHTPSAYSMHPNEEGIKKYKDEVQGLIKGLEDGTIKRKNDNKRKVNGGTDNNSTNNSVDSAVWKAGYLEKVNKLSSNYLYCLAILKDLDGDGVPELFLDGGNDSPDWDSYSYTYKDDKVKELEYNLGFYASEVCYFVSDKYLLRADYGQDVGGMWIKISELENDSIVEILNYRVTGMYGPDCKSTFEIKSEDGGIVSEEELKNTLEKYGFICNCEYTEKTDNGEFLYGLYTINFVTKEGNGEIETIYGFDMLKKAIENYGTDVYDKAISEALCDGEYQAYRYSFSRGLAKDWQLAFYDKLQEVAPTAVYESNGTDESAYSYFLYDIEKDGIPELFIRYGNCEAAFHYSVYKYENGGLTEYKNYCSHTGFYSVPGNGFVTFQAHMGDYSISMNTLENGEINTENGASEYTEEEYPEPEDIYPGAEYINEYSFKFFLPLYAYENDIKTKSNKTNDEVRNILQDAVSDNERVYAIVTDSFRAADYIGYDYLSDFFDKGDFDKYNDLVKEDILWGDLNNDGQDECVMVLREVGSDSTSRVCVILSYQCGIVYAYSMGYMFGDVQLQDDLIIDDDHYEQVYFYKDEFYKDSYW